MVENIIVKKILRVKRFYRLLRHLYVYGTHSQPDEKVPDCDTIYEVNDLIEFPEKVHDNEFVQFKCESLLRLQGIRSK